MIRNIFMSLLTAFFIVMTPAANVTSSIYIELRASVAEAGIGRKAIIGYAVAKALQMGSRAARDKLGDLASNPRVRSQIIDAVQEQVRKNPRLRQKADELLSDLQNRFGGANQSPYSPRGMERLIEDAAEVGQQVRSSTLPRTNAPNVRLAGRGKEVGDEVVPFDNRGFPIFDRFAKFDTRLPNFDPRSAPDDHFRSATEMLRNAIRRGEVDPRQFNESALDAIAKGKPRSPGYTWHHHQDLSRMQLIARDIHEGARHIGGQGLWR